MNEYIKVNISDISPTIFFFTDSLYTCNIDEHVKLGQNVRKTVVCVECQKPRCIYAKKQLSVRNARALARLMEKYDYTCGSLITPDGSSMYFRHSIPVFL